MKIKQWTHYAFSESCCVNLGSLEQCIRTKGPAMIRPRRPGAENCVCAHNRDLEPYSWKGSEKLKFNCSTQTTTSHTYTYSYTHTPIHTFSLCFMQNIGCCPRKLNVRFRLQAASPVHLASSRSTSSSCTLIDASHTDGGGHGRHASGRTKRS